MITQWIFAILLAQLAVLLANLCYWRCRRKWFSALPNTDLPRLSILIPVRNERDKLPMLVEALHAQQVKPFEVILCDDSSEDTSREWLEANLPMHPSPKWLSWFPAPAKQAGWVGKNWACHQLAQRARGDWLVFLDADIRLHKHSIQFLIDHLSHIDRRRVQLVTAIPKLRANRLFVGLLKSMLPFSVFTLLPIPLAEKYPHPAFAFANGQMMAFPRDYYQQTWLHERARQAILEDVHIAREVKLQGGQVVILDGRSIFEVNMYSTLRDAVDGFSKNATAICGSVPAAIVVALLLALVYLAPLLEASLGGVSGWHMVSYGLSSLLFALSAWMVDMPLWFGCLYPLTLLIGEWTLWRSIFWYARGEVRWKGRTYRVR